MRSPAGLLVIVWFALIGLAVALTVAAAQHHTLPGDKVILNWGQDRAFPGEHLSDAVRVVTGTEVVVATGVLIALGLWLLGLRVAAVVLVVGVLILPFFQVGLKELVDRPRPGGAEVDLRAGFSSSSFPSGHTMSPTVLYGFLFWVSLRAAFWHAPRLMAIVAAPVLILLAGAASVWQGVHWPSDVLGGWAWGVILVAGLVFLYELLVPWISSFQTTAGVGFHSEKSEGPST